jgi:hypothetical protein
LRIYAVNARSHESDSKCESDDYIRNEQNHRGTVLRVAAVDRNHGAGDLSRVI